MHFSIEKEVFLKGLARVQGIVEKRNTIPILSNVLVEADKEGLFITATDLEVGMRAKYPASIKSPGKITVSAKKIFEIIKELPEKEIIFKAKDNCWIEISCGKSVFNIVGLSSDEFPHFPQPDETKMIPISGQLLGQMIEKTYFSVSTDETKYNLNGIYFKTIEEDQKKYLLLVATDGHRLALDKRAVDTPEIEELINGVVFPRKGIIELKKITEETEADIKLGFMDNSAVVIKDDTIVVMRLVDGDFPDYNRVIPQNNEEIISIPRDNFLHALKRMAILSSEKSKGVKIDLKHGTLEISSSNPEIGDAHEELEIDYKSDEMSIGFNARYMIDILQVLDEEKIKLAVKDNLSPGLITPDGDDGFLAVVMPMRL
ncbi:MAG: DNA polymerase III subunit beta [Desulfuromonas sp.]|nr:MAG: DNA polymerase III subunit beta [Desulfuromonas sp.]